MPALLLPAMLQQFVHGKTQRPLKFSYYPVELQGLADGLPAAAICSLELTAQVAESETNLRDLVKRHDEVPNSGND